MALEELHAAVCASRYLLGSSVVNDGTARSWFTQVDFDGSGARPLDLLQTQGFCCLAFWIFLAATSICQRGPAGTGTLTRRAFREILPELGLADLGFHLSPSRVDGLVDAMAPDGSDVIRWADFLVHSGLDVTSKAGKRWARAQRRTVKDSSSKPIAQQHSSTSPSPAYTQRSVLDVPDRAARDALFDAFDANSNGKLSLAEIDKAVVEAFPEFDHKPALLLAYKATEPAVYGDGWITRSSFSRLLRYIVYFNNLWHRFEEIDADGDRRISEDEWVRGSATVGLKVSAAEARSAFRRMCVDNHAQNDCVLFGWFCEWCARTHHAQTKLEDCVGTPHSEPELQPEPEPPPQPEPEPDPVVIDETAGEALRTMPRRTPRAPGCGRQIDTVELLHELVLHALLEQESLETGIGLSPDKISRELSEGTSTARLAVIIGQEAWNIWVSTSRKVGSPDQQVVPVIWFLEWILDLYERTKPGARTISANVAALVAALGDHTVTILQQTLVVLRCASGDLDEPTPVQGSTAGMHGGDLHPIGFVTAMRRGYTPLILASARGCSLMVRLLLHCGAAVDVRCGAAQPLVSNDHTRLRGGTALHAAAQSGHSCTLQWLLGEGGARTHFRDQQGRTALAVAAARGNVEVSRQLLLHKANVGLTDERGRTALMCAIDTGHIAVAALMLQHEVQSLWIKRGKHVHYTLTVNSVDTVGFTSLMSAAAQGRADMVKLLLAHSADIDAQTTCCCNAGRIDKCRCRVGTTALALAVVAHHGEAAAMLMEHGATDLDGSGALCANAWKRRKAAIAAAASSPPAPVATYTKWLRKRPPLVIPDRESRMILFDRIDVNGNKQLSLAEIDKYIAETFPDYDHKPALMRAYRAADKDGSSRIERKEFSMLLRLLVYFNHLWDVFDSIDSNSDHRLGLAEFAEGCKAVGLQLTALEAQQEFKAADINGGGFVLFEEFTIWCAKRQVVQDDWEAQEEAAVAEVA